MPPKGAARTKTLPLPEFSPVARWAAQKILETGHKFPDLGFRDYRIFIGCPPH
jgi:hypothetical protein